MKIANIMVLLGAAGLIGGVVYKMILLYELGWWMPIVPSAFLKFSTVCLLLGMALYLRIIALKES